MTQQQEKEKAIIQTIIAIRNRLKLMSVATQLEIKTLIDTHQITAHDLIDMCVEMNYRS